VAGVTRIHKLMGLKGRSAILVEGDYNHETQLKNSALSGNVVSSVKVTDGLVGDATTITFGGDLAQPPTESRYAARQL
jgi:hypothetical protein